MSPRLQARTVLAVASLALALAVAGFFRNLSTALTDYSWGDSSYHTQILYNFTVGRPFQTSLYHNPTHGVLDNPAPYANQASVHINLTPFLFVPLFALKPDIYGLYVLSITVVLLSALGAVLLVFREGEPSDRDTSARTAIALTLLVSSSLFRLAHYKGHMLLFATPFFLGMDAAARRRKIPAYLVLAVLTALVGEDSAMLVMGHAAYLWLCDRDLRRPAAAAAAMAAVLLGLMVFVLMPAARFEMVQENASHMFFILSHPSILLTGVKTFPRETRIVMILLPALAALRLTLDPGPRSSDRRLAALILIAPASHWLITLLTFGVHRLVPPLLCMLLAASLLLADGTSAWTNALRRRAAIACAILYAALSLWNVSKDLPRLLTPEQSAESAANRAFISAVRERVPRNASLVIWTDTNAEAFLADRSDLWRFPEYYDEVDYLAIQPDSPRSWLANPPLPGKSARETMLPPQWRDASPIPRDAASLIKQELVYLNATHDVLRDDANILLLKRKVPKPFPIPPTSVGFGYFRNIPALFSRH